MINLLILYPALFACRGKFERKLGNITGNFSTFNIVHQGDPQRFIVNMFSADEKVRSIREATPDERGTITHAVVFDDGEEYADERAWLADSDIPTRWINVPLTRVINIKREPEYQGLRSTAHYEYIGRGSYWGNPHSMLEAGESREEVMRKYRYDFEHDKFLNVDPKRVHELTGKRLGCFCSPDLCHGDILADYLNGFDDGT